MPMKVFNPYTPSRRFITVEDFSEITTNRPEKSLLAPLTKKAGRNNTGQVMVRFRGGGHKRMYRIIDFKRDKVGIPGVVATIEYDPNRTCRIALINYADGEKRYILQPVGLKVGDKIMAGPTAEIHPGNALPLANIPVGSFVHNVELIPGKGGQMVRSAGASAQIMAREGGYAQVKLPSGEIRLIHMDCWATIGQVGNSEYKSVRFGKAGRKRWLGRKPHVRGIAMNPVDHPHGGGEGKSGQGNPHPVSPWGWHTKGRKTRDRNKYSRKLIVKRRK